MLGGPVGVPPFPCGGPPFRAIFISVETPWEFSPPQLPIMSGGKKAAPAKAPTHGAQPGNKQGGQKYHLGRLDPLTGNYGTWGCEIRIARPKLADKRLPGHQKRFRNTRNRTFQCRRERNGNKMGLSPGAFAGLLMGVPRALKALHGSGQKQNPL